MSFKEFIAARLATDDPAGDFVADAKADAAFPDAIRWSEVEAHCRQAGWCVEAREAAREVWREYAATVLPS